MSWTVGTEGWALALVPDWRRFCPGEPPPPEASPNLAGWFGPADLRRRDMKLRSQSGAALVPVALVTVREVCSMSMDRDVTEVLRRYGAEHADTYGDLRWDRDHYVISFTDDLEQHRSNLRSLLGHLSSVEVVASRHTSAHLTEVIETVRAEFRGHERRVLSRSAPGQLTLRAPYADIAADLHRRYGDALDITVGSKPFPPERITESAAVPVPVSTVSLPHLAIVLHFETPAVVAGEDLRGSATLTNRGHGPLSFITGPMTGGVRQPGDDKLAGTFRGSLAAAGLIVDLRPGQSKDIPVLIGTASCLPDRSYVVPAGTYEAVTILSVNLRDDHGNPTSPERLVVMGPSIEVTPDRQALHEGQHHEPGVLIGT